MNKTFEFNHSNIHYIDEGEGKVLVFLHGFLESKEVWSDFIRNLKSTFRIIAVDLPGHGESGQVGEIHSIDMQAQLIHDILVGEKIGKAIIIGHSMGGYIAAAFCEQYEQMSAGLVFFHSHAAPDSDEAKERRVKMSHIVRENKTGLILQFIPGLFDPRNVEKYSSNITALQQAAMKMSPGAIVASIMGMRERIGSVSYLSAAKIPVLFIIGKQDGRTSYAQALAQSKLPPHSEVLLLEGVGHMGYIEAAHTTIEAVKYFAIRSFGQE